MATKYVKLEMQIDFVHFKMNSNGRGDLRKASGRLVASCLGHPDVTINASLKDQSDDSNITFGRFLKRVFTAYNCELDMVYVEFSNFPKPAECTKIKNMFKHYATMRAQCS